MSLNPFTWFSKKPIIINKPRFQTNFVNDFACLFFLLEKEELLISQKLGIITDPNSPISDSLIIEIIKETTIKIIQSLSEEYMEVLYQYLTNEGIESLIIEHFTTKLVEYGITVNKKIIIGNFHQEVVGKKI